MTKKLDFDFSDVTGSAPPQAIPKAEPVTEDEEPKTLEPEVIGITLTFPSSEEGEYQIKDLALCTPEEFLRWCALVAPCYPLGLRQAKTIPNRLETYKRIVGWGNKVALSLGKRGQLTRM